MAETEERISLHCLTIYPLLEIMSYLSCDDKRNLSLTCRAMNAIYQCPENWRSVKLRFYCSEDGNTIAYVKQFKMHFWNVIIELDTSKVCNRENAVFVINLISSCPLRGLTLITAESKPLFYGGADIIKAMNKLFSSNNESPDLRYINLEQFLFYMDDGTLHTLHYNHKLIEFLYLGEMAIRITNEEMICLVKTCIKLKVISTSLNCLSKEVLSIFTQPGRIQLQHILIKCGVYCTNNMCRDVFDSDMWLRVKTCLPSLTVGIHVDENCSFDLVKIMLKPVIPYSVIRFETFTPLCEEVDLVGKFYNKTLEKLIIHPSKERKELDNSLLNLCTLCQSLRSLHVFALLQPETIKAILRQKPLMHRRETYTLKAYRGIGPWAMEEILAR